MQNTSSLKNSFKMGDEVKFDTDSSFPEYGKIVGLGKTFAMVQQNYGITKVRYSSLELQNRAK